MEPIAGLYIAYEIVSGIAAVAGANATVIELSNRLINITKILEQRSTKTNARETANPVVEERGADEAQGQVDRLTTLLLLLAHSEVKVDLGALRLCLQTVGGIQRLGNLLFLPPDSNEPMALSEIPPLLGFTALRGSRVRWDGERRRMEILGILHLDVASLAGETTITLTRQENCAEISVTAGGTDGLRLVYAQSSHSKLFPIQWSTCAPVLQIWHCIRSGQTKQTLLAEVLVPVTDEPQAETSHAQ